MSEQAHPPTPPAARPEPRRSLVVCTVIGIAVMAAVDEIVFHQVLS